MTATSSLTTDSRTLRLLGSAIVFVLVLALYAPCFQFSFINLDDDVYVYQNPHVISGLTLENVRWAFSNPHGGHWHPLTWISHMLDCDVFGLEAGAHHGVNVFFHATNGVLVFLLLLRLFHNSLWALLLSIIFVAHPMRIESVAWIAERKDVLSMFFALLSFHSYLSFADSRRVTYYVLLLLCFIFGLLAKPMLVSLPVLFLLLDYWPRNVLSLDSTPLVHNHALQRSILEKIPLFIVSAMMCSIVIYTQQHDGGLKSLSSIPLADRLANVFVSYMSYAGKFFWPVPVAIFYPFQYYAPGVAAGAFLGVLACSVLCLQQPYKPSLIVGWIWFLVTLLPVIGIVYVGGQSFADRWSYLPHLGIILGAGAWLHNTFYYRKVLLYSSTGVLCLLCIALTMSQLPHWKNSEALFTHTLDVTPENFLAHTNLGVALSRMGREDEAAYHYREAARIKPYYPKAMNHLGLVEASAGNYDAAIELFTKALQRDQSLTSARFNLGLAYQRKGHILTALTTWLTSSAYSEPLHRHLEEVIDAVFTQSCPQLRRGIKDWEQLPQFSQSLHQFGPQMLSKIANKTALEAESCLLSSPRAVKTP